MNENYPQPSLPAGVADSVIRGMYRYATAPAEAPVDVRLLGSGAILREVIDAVTCSVRNGKSARRSGA